MQTCQEAADAAAVSDLVHALCLTNLGNALLALAEHTGNVSALEQSVKTHRAAVTGTPPRIPSEDP